MSPIQMYQFRGGPDIRQVPDIRIGENAGLKMVYFDLLIGSMRTTSMSN